MKPQSFLEIKEDFLELIVLNDNNIIVFFKSINLLVAEDTEVDLFQRKDIFEMIVILISEAENELNVLIEEIILIIKSNHIKAQFIEIKASLSDNYIISANQISKMDKTMISNLKSENQNIKFLDIVKNKYYLDGIEFFANNIVGNKGKEIYFNGYLVYIQDFFLNQLTEILNNLKIKIHHIVNPTIAIFEVNPNYFSNKNILFINIDLFSTELIIRNNNIILLKNTLDFGIYKIISNVSSVSKISFDKVMLYLANNIHNTELNTLFLSEFKNMIFDFKKYTDDLDQNFKIDEVIINSNYNHYNIENFIKEIFNIEGAQLNNIHFSDKKMLINLKNANIQNISYSLISSVLFYTKHSQKNIKKAADFVFGFKNFFSCFLKRFFY